MPSMCKHCYEDEFDNEEQVCKACGITDGVIQFGSEFIPHSSNISYKASQGQKKPPAGLAYGTDILNSLSKMYNISSYVKEEILELLKSVYAQRSFRYKQDVGVMAGCCLIHVQKKHQQYVPLSDLCAKLKCTMKQAHKFSKELQKIICKLNDFNDHPDADDIPEKSVDCNSDTFAEIESKICIKLSSAPEDNKALLISKTSALVKLAYSCWIVSGRSYEAIISAAAFLCWKSLDPSRRTLSFKRFCTDFSLPYDKAKSRVPELKAMLLKLGERIPSLTKNYVNEKNVLFHLNYILENSETLRNNLLSEEFTVDEINKKEFSVFRRSKPKSNKGTIESESVKYDIDMCASDVEISDTEIDSYIRTKEQVEMIVNLRKRKHSET